MVRYADPDEDSEDSAAPSKAAVVSLDSSDDSDTKPLKKPASTKPHASTASTTSKNASGSRYRQSLDANGKESTSKPSGEGRKSDRGGGGDDDGAMSSYLQRQRGQQESNGKLAKLDEEVRPRSLHIFDPTSQIVIFPSFAYLRPDTLFFPPPSSLQIASVAEQLNTFQQLLTSLQQERRELANSISSSRNKPSTSSSPAIDAVAGSSKTGDRTGTGGGIDYEASGKGFEWSSALRSTMKKVFGLDGGFRLCQEGCVIPQFLCL
jgi:hypothetical protein